MRYMYTLIFKSNQKRITSCFCYEPITLKRKELYELVWSEPLIKLSKKFGLSDNGLRKICKRHNIPVPGIGYWAKKAAGQQLKKIPLANTSSEKTITINPSPSYPLRSDADSTRSPNS